MTWEGNDMISKKVGIVESIKSSDDNLEDIILGINLCLAKIYCINSSSNFIVLPPNFYSPLYFHTIFYITIYILLYYL